MKSFLVSVLLSLVAGQAAFALESCSVECNNGGVCEGNACRCSSGYFGKTCSISSGDSAFMLLCTCLVFLMTPGLALFYGGLVGVSNSINTQMMSFVAIPVISLQWVFFGYSLSFSRDVLIIYGDLWWGLLKNVGLEPNPDYGPSIPHLLHMAYNMMFAFITPALISGAVIGRLSLKSYLIFIFLWSTIVYDITCHWVWAGTNVGTSDEKLGWLRQQGALDFGGGLVVHLTAGVSALTAALVVGKRKAHKDPLPPHNVMMVITGTGLLWFGWFGFNGGNLFNTHPVATAAVVNTHISTCSAVAVWMVLLALYKEPMISSQLCVAAVVGMIVATPSSGYVEAWAELIFGSVGAVASFYAMRLRQRWYFDDTLDVFAAHGVGGMVGPVLTGLFATKSVNPFGNDGAFYGNPKQFGVQIMAVVVITVLSASVTAGLLYALKYTVRVRVPAEVEDNGLDLAVHGEHGYVLFDPLFKSRPPLIKAESLRLDGDDAVRVKPKRGSWTADKVGY